MKTWVASGSVLPVEGLAETVDHAYLQFEGDYRGMMWGLTHVIGGFDANTLVPVWWQGFQGAGFDPLFVDQDWLPYRNNPEYNDPEWGAGQFGTWIHSLRGDWREDYWDKTANQGYHFWFLASVAFFEGPAWSLAANLYHDSPACWEDYDFIHSPEDEPPPGSGCSFPDFLLGLKGLSFGSALRFQSLSFAFNGTGCPDTPLPASFVHPGSWIRSNLR